MRPPRPFLRRLQPFPLPLSSGPPNPGFVRVALAALIVAAFVPAVAGEWNSFHGDERNTGFQAGDDYALFEETWWSLKLPNVNIEASPVMAEGLVVIGGH